VILVGAYFLLPLYVMTANCSDSSCSPPIADTMWELSLRLLSHFGFAPIGNALILGLCYRPLLSAVVGVGCGIIYLVWARHAFAVWSTSALIAGTAALLLMLLFLLPFRPQIGYLGMLVGFGLLWAGSRLLIRASRQLPIPA
jgi:hypothetical protein